MKLWKGPLWQPSHISNMADVTKYSEISAKIDWSAMNIWGKKVRIQKSLAAIKFGHGLPVISRNCKSIIF